MPLSETQRADVARRLTAFCEARSPAAVRHQVRVGFSMKGNEAVIFEERPDFHEPRTWRELPVAKLRYVSTRREWRLYCQHRDLRWHAYEALPAAANVDRLLAEVDADPTGIFWG